MIHKRRSSLSLSIELWVLTSSGKVMFGAAHYQACLDNQIPFLFPTMPRDEWNFSLRLSLGEGLSYYAGLAMEGLGGISWVRIFLLSFHRVNRVTIFLPGVTTSESSSPSLRFQNSGAIFLPGRLSLINIGSNPHIRLIHGEMLN